jgi:fructosamine-3-kinase
LLGEDGRRFFVKLNDAAQLSLFEAEAMGLNALAAAHVLRVPQPLTWGIAGQYCFIAMEWIALTSEIERKPAAKLGEQLALLHRKTSSTFGWERDNRIGSTHQANPATTDWIAFYREHRLRAQFQLAAKNGAPRVLLDSGERLLAVMAHFFSSYTPQASLLHGDLWRGNVGFCADEPVLFDPAVYFGDRETDLAMTELFGGFSPTFYAAYHATWPLDPGYAQRKLLYQLYHLLNHFNLFGGRYAQQSQTVINQLLATLR